ncbi:type I-F CRISPR-associated endoribonuclease Cas6/Csy4 [bacterium (Candidatus Blackallbacteria) CG17_big_fil_post_rev_8_21_14_2_50_48_46]|uniref:Type I-F CRISPR-associated endoribonuclease Cas6/Csy4 n=1 Tax=bacterium (Candidatus Blackallbacteria) CG17_big_fil_post_rev_8_21_14_2_50_48_46 TaxID=2014261 RepID=A0A2M7G8Y1_9BACT|nr:MAG: type I-F CRISPR-associated endoribonuclease Cas6/Csy4 [bacterium (Candidatus Blackallbacteria) CG18_big_fil_WC_8_21_14_2_50_49_26]PIW18547.1 MAG: type I-F CRISPR-associated endoribonuclease Cas6/Csy4 [bacterium (Candidatus Blackallbacteria) CG17_big_fil_post_rev_8_21_14_2_50_48_46]PIW46468.1 MAG: type I-F CRISPR-associated endoribonuclease Cas6/Csy4 [bacterium (Candidatus Blackallbacteria) CG13_big_fil_rev_8_21_14_2_50_49_14]
MEVFQQLTLLPTPEAGVYFLWEKIFQQVHLALVEIQNPDGQISVGISFPDYDGQSHFLGERCRFFATERDLLEKLRMKQWLSRFNDYVDLSGIRDVPDRIDTYAVYRRLQPKSSIERLARRKAKREGLSFEQAMAFLQSFKPQEVRTPYILMNSHSSERRFQLFIQKEVVENPVSGYFSTYGLSSHSTVPEF